MTWIFYIQIFENVNADELNKLASLKKKTMKRSAAVCFKRFPFAVDFSVVDSLVRH